MRVYLINNILNPVFHLLFLPFAGRDPLWALIWISLLTAVLALLIYRYFSSQDLIKQVKNQIKAHILEMRLFQQDPVLMGRAVRSVLGANLFYLRLNLKPFLFMFIPVILILIQTEARIGYRPLHTGESVKVRSFWISEKAMDEPTCYQLNPSEGLAVNGSPLRIKENREILWKINAHKIENTLFSLSNGNETVSIPVQVSDSSRLVPISPWNGQKGSLKNLFFPAAHLLPSGGELTTIEIDYPQREIHLWGYNFHWIWAFLFLTLALGYLLKGFFRVQF